jgi:predicted alpha/beta superfamily hydrolase
MRIYKIVFLSFFLLTSYQFTNAQNKVTFLLKQPSLLHSMDNIFVAGNFNMWNPADKNYLFSKSTSGIDSLIIELPSGNYEYKFTRGNWEKVETDSAGNGIKNRILNLQSDSIIRINIPAWNDDFKHTASSKKNNSASVNVKIIDTAFYMPQLNRTRRIWLYLPPDYAKSKKKYPVIYMHDGQNLFENKTSYSGEWGVDEYLDSIFKSGKKEVIVVGIDNGLSKRMSEYNPWEFQSFGKGEGSEYVDFLVKTLKPFIDKNYRTLKDKPNTFIAGSSMGGLISLYATLKYPQIFGGAGIFSPAFWTASGIDSLVITDAKNLHSKLFFYAGGKEGDAMVPDMKRIEKEIRQRSNSSLKEVIDEDAQHNEAAWRKYFPAFYEWAILNSKK